MVDIPSTRQQALQQHRYEGRGELRVDRRGLRIGEPLSQFRGVLTRTPEYLGSKDPQLEDGRSGVNLWKERTAKEGRRSQAASSDS
ncbi:hypothetical protein GFL49_24365 [Rhizobium leguminosarum bv. viciae]|nr:hypothetical protein [Rhizobium leguminosarum bv. viciae]